MTPTATREVIVIDAGIPDWKTLVANLDPTIAVILLPSGGNGLAALALALADYGTLDALHLVSHGSEGQLHLGDLRLNSANLGDQSDALTQIARHLTPESDLLLYGCSVAAGERGRAFVDTLSNALNGVDVAASVDRTGALELGGDWDLEYWAGQIETMLPFSVEDIVDYKAAVFADDYQAVTVDNTTDTATLDSVDGVSFSEAVAILAADTIANNTYLYLGTAFATSGTTLVSNLAINESFTLNADAVTSGTTLAGSTVTVASGVILSISNTTGSSATIASILAGAGALKKFDAGTLTLSGSNTYTGATTVSAGTLAISNASALGTNAGGTTVASGAALSLSGGITVAENLTVSGSGISSGGALISASGSNTLSGTVAMAVATRINAISNLTLSGVLSGGFALTKTGAGTLTLLGSNTYTGATTLLAGTLAISNASALGTNAGGTTVASGAALSLSGGITVAENLTVSGSGISSGGALISASGSNTLSGTVAMAVATIINATSNLTLSGVLSGGFALTKTGAGTLTLAGSNTYTGATTVSAGTLAISNASALGTSAGGTTVASGAALSLSGGITFAENLTVSGSGISSGGALVSASGSNTLSGTVAMAADTTINATSNLTLSGVLSGGFALTKSGTGTLTLAGSNTYIGATAVSAGTLLINGTHSGTGAVTVASGASLGGSGSVAGAVSVSTGGTITAGTSITAEDLATANLAIAGTLSAQLGGTTVVTGYDQLVVTGTVDLTGATLSASLINSFAPAVGDSFILIENDSTDTITGAFTGLAEGATVTIGGYGFRISYAGGTYSNDVVLTAIDTTAPVFQSAATSTDGTKVILTYGEALNAVTAGTGDFTVLVGGSARTVSTATVNGSTVELTLASPIINGQTVTVAYADPNVSNDASAVQDAAGNDAVTLADQSVTNSTPAAPALTSAAYNASTGVLSVAGANLSNGGAVDVSKLSVTGQGGASYTLSGAYAVNASSTTAFVVTLDATDKINVNGLLNNVLTSSVGGTSFNLAAATSWMSGAAADSITAVTVSNVTAPTLTSAAYDASTGVLVVTGTCLVKAFGSTNDITANKITLTGEGGSTYTLTDTANVEIVSGTSFTLTLSATDKEAINQSLNNNGTTSTSGTSFNLAAADDWNTVIGNADIADTTGNGITVSNVAVPTLTSATYNAATGVLTIAGTGFLSKSGAPNDIVANKFALTGEGGAFYVLTDTADVEVTSGTSVTLILSATDRAAINQVINKNGTSSADATPYNLAATEDWASGAAAAVVVADLTGNGITVSDVNIAPTVTNSNISISGASGTGGAYKIGDTVTATWNNTAGGDNNSGVTGVTMNFSQFGGGAAVAATNSSDTWTATYTLTSGAVDATNRNVSVTANNGTATTTADTTNASVDNVAPAVSDASIGISGGTGTGGAFKIGDTVTASWDNSAIGDDNSDTIASATVNFSQFGGGAAVAATNSSDTWTATYTLTAGVVDAPSRNVSVTATDNAGNTTTTADSTNATVDNAAPTVTGVTSSTTNGSYKVGDTVSVQVNFSEAVTVTGTPQLTLETGTTDQVVNYASGSGTSTLTFTYTVQVGDTTADLDYQSTTALALNGGTINDAAGNAVTLTLASPGAANSLGNNKALVIDGVVPTISSINRVSTATTNATNLDYTVTFAEGVTGVGASDFALTATGTAAGSLASVSGSGTTYTVTVNSVTGDGTLRLDLKSSGTGIVDTAGNAIALGYTSGQTYTLDHTAPAVASLTLVGTPTASATSIDYTVTFGESVTGLDVSDFTLTTTGASGGTIASVSGSGTTYTVTVNAISGSGTVRLDLNASGTGIGDAAGNAIVGGYTIGSVHTASFNTAPVISNMNGDSVAWAGVGNAVTLDVLSNLTVSDTENDAASWNGASLTVQRFVGSTSTPLSSDIFIFNASGFTVNGSDLQTGGSTTFGTFTNTGGVLTINFNSNATNALVQGVMRGIQYRNDTPTGDTTVRFSLSDGSLATTADVNVTSDTIYVTNTTDTASIGVSDGVSFSEAVAIAAADTTGSQTLVLGSAFATTGTTLVGNLVIDESLTLNADAVTSGTTLAGSTITITITYSFASPRILTITNTTGGSVTIASILAGDGQLGSLTKTGAGTLTLSGTNTYIRVTTVSEGTLAVSGGAAIANSGTVIVASGATLALNASESINALSGAGNVTLGSHVLTLGSASGSGTFSGIISGAGALTQVGSSSTITLSGANTYTGATTVSAGRLTISNASALGTTAGDTTVASGAVLSLSGGISIAENLTLSGTGTKSSGALVSSGSGRNTVSGTVAMAADTTVSASADLTLSGVLSGGFALTKAGMGTLTLSGANTYTGATMVSAGTLAISNDSALGSTDVATIVSSGAVLSLSGGISIAENLTLSGSGISSGGALVSAGGINTITGTVVMAAATTIAATGDLTLSGVLSGGFALTKIGAGTLTLSGANTYTGATMVSTGNLLIDGAHSGNGALTVASGASLGGNGTVAGAVTVSTGGIISAGTTTGAEDLATANLVIAGTLSAQLGGTTAGSDYDQLRVTGTVDLGGATLSSSLINSFTPVAGNSFTLIDNDAMDAITGTLKVGGTTLAEGATFLQDGLLYAISYTGGTGNDLVLSALGPRSLAYSATTFSEAAANNGSTAATSTITLTHDTFTGAVGAALGTVTNVPAGLTAVVVKASATTATLSFTGNATAHTNAQDIANLSVTFADADFAAGSATTVTGATRADLVMDFADPAPVDDGGGVTPTPITDTDGVTDATENAVSPLTPTSGGTAVAGDGNGDGVADSQQSGITSTPFRVSPTAISNPGTSTPVYITLVADAKDGKIDTTDANTATLTNVRQLDTPTNLPDTLKMPLGQIAFSAGVGLSGVPGVGVTETFSLYADTSLGANGYFKQNAAGTWVNLASSVTQEGGKTRVDFSLTDGGEFDADGVVNGTIVDPGALGTVTRPVFGLRDKVLALYIAYFDRAPDTQGLQYWVNQAQAGQSLNDISAGFAAHPRFAQEYGALSNSQIAAKLYLNLLHRPGDTAGLAYWGGELQTRSVSDVVVSFTASALAVNLDAALSQGALTVAEYTTAYQRQKVLENLMQASEHFMSTFGAATATTQGAQTLAQDPAYLASQSVLNHVDSDLNAVYNQRDQLVKLVGQVDAMQQVVNLLG